jgi:hypothetical protein
MGRVLDLNECLALIRSFCPGPFPCTGVPDTLVRLDTERSQRLPADFRHYLQHAVPPNGHSFRTIGHPIQLHPASRLSWCMPGYNVDPILKLPMPGWKDSWFLFANASADPIIIDLNDSGEYSRVYQSLHGLGVWSFYPVADSLGQFLLCAAALEHALTHLGQSHPVHEDEQGFRLADAAADWLFPFFERCASKYYDDWLSVFDNA